MRKARARPLPALRRSVPTLCGRVPSDGRRYRLRPRSGRAGNAITLPARHPFFKHIVIVEAHDITHALAILLNNQLEPDPRWTSFGKACQSTRQQLQQTAGSFRQPPAWRRKRGFSTWALRDAWGFRGG